MDSIENITRDARIMIIDDDPGTVEILSRIVKGIGKVYATTKGLDAMNLARSCLPDLILLDIEMPDISGFDVCAVIKSDPLFVDVPIIFVTSHQDREIESRALTSGAIDFIHKPPHPLVVKARVKNYLTLKRQTDHLKLLSSLDGLTGIANRRCFDTALHQEWRRAFRNQTPLALLLVDVDYFKQFNDTYGHQAGDQCLRVIADVLANIVKRPGELAARYGGEEFVILLPYCTQEQTVFLAEMICAEVRMLALPHETSDVAATVTVSIGISSIETIKKTRASDQSSYREGFLIDSDDLGAEDLVLTADQAMYDAKHEGRNRVCVFKTLEK